MASLLSQLASFLPGGSSRSPDLRRLTLTYRARDIPERYATRQQCREIIESSLSTTDTPCAIIVRSFASHIEHNPARTSTTRTIVFDLKTLPSAQLATNAANEWELLLYDNEGQPTGEYIIIDTHFNGFTVISSPEDDEHEFDFIALSGLGSHAWGSFKRRGQKSMWIADKLPKNWPRTRIMIYGYDSQIIGTRSRQTLGDIGATFKNKLIEIRRRPSSTKKFIPLVFLAHSLGGLVLKQALVDLSKQSRAGRGGQESKEAFQSVHAMLFFGVPCKGLDGDRLGLAAMAKGQSTEGFLSDLRGDSQLCANLAQDFLSVFNGLDWVKIFSFYETMESATAKIDRLGRPTMTGPTERWVGKEAAFNGREFERLQDETYSIPIHTDHSGLVKCDREEDFRTISYYLVSLDWRAAKNGVESSKSSGFKDPPIATEADATELERVLPPGLKLTLIGGPIVQQYPVLRWGLYMYWPVSFEDNRMSTALITTDTDYNILNRLDYLGARYVHQIIVTKDRNVKFIGQADQIITIPWEQLSAIVGIPEWFRPFSMDNDRGKWTSKDRDRHNPKSRDKDGDDLEALD